MKTTLPILLSVFACALCRPVWADRGREMPSRVPATYTQECAACHLAYPPGLLPSTSWQRIMGGLDRHYGSDASLDPAQVQEISRWLSAHAGTYKYGKTAPPEERITRSTWFERKHRQIDPVIWKLPSVKSPAHCAACHKGAEHGQFSDHQLRMPDGLNPAQQRAWRD